MLVRISRRQRYLPLRATGWGGRRPGAGRKPGPDPRIQHRSRETFAARFPCHVTVRVRGDVPSLRTVRLVHEVERSLAGIRARGDFRVVHYSLQSNHGHFIVEAAGRDALGRGMKSVGARLARAVNRIFDRQGPVLEDRYHVRVLRTPLQVRRTLAYVLLNARRHSFGVRRRSAALDPASSARWFDGWKRGGRRRDAEVRPCVARARSWLLDVGWRRHGLLDPTEVPGGARGPACFA
jgi:REP element-mobilizing transposase RayT